MEEGYYYGYYHGGWEIVEKIGLKFYRPLFEDGYTEKDFEKFGPRIPMPDEPFEAHYKFARELGKLCEGEYS